MHWTALKLDWPMIDVSRQQHTCQDTRASSAVLLLICRCLCRVKEKRWRYELAENHSLDLWKSDLHRALARIYDAAVKRTLTRASKKSMRRGTTEFEVGQTDLLMLMLLQTPLGDINHTNLTVPLAHMHTGKLEWACSHNELITSHRLHYCKHEVTITTVSNIHTFCSEIVVIFLFFLVLKDLSTAVNWRALISKKLLLNWKTKTHEIVWIFSFSLLVSHYWHFHSLTSR